MWKTRLACCMLAVILAVSAMVTDVLALSSQQYKELLLAEDFRVMDKVLNSTWKKVYSQQKGAKKKELLKEQREWLKSDRDLTAEIYMEQQGEDMIQAYCHAMADRIDELNERFGGMTPEEQLSVRKREEQAARQKARQELKALENDDAEALSYCGRVTKKNVIPGSIISMLTMADFEGNSMGNFLDGDDRYGEDVYFICNDAKIDTIICFDVYKVVPPSDMGLDDAGVKDPIVRWIKNCRVPG